MFTPSSSPRQQENHAYRRLLTYQQFAEGICSDYELGICGITETIDRLESAGVLHLANDGIRIAAQLRAEVA